MSEYPTVDAGPQKKIDPARQVIRKYAGIKSVSQIKKSKENDSLQRHGRHANLSEKKDTKDYESEDPQRERQSSKAWQTCKPVVGKDTQREVVESSAEEGREESSAVAPLGAYKAESTLRERGRHRARRQRAQQEKRRLRYRHAIWRLRLQCR